jgi:hypothetical protein
MRLAGMRLFRQPVPKLLRAFPLPFQR